MYYQDLNPDSLVDVLKKLNPDENESFFIMIGENNKIDLSKVIDNINNVGYSFFGGIFPGLLFRKISYTDGLIITKVRTNSKTQVINNLNDNSFIVPEFNNLLSDSRKKTAIVLVDGLTQNISSFLSTLFNNLGDTVNYLGGGCGSLSLKSQPCLFTNDGFYDNSALVTIVDSESNLGVKHGWEMIDNQLIATKTDMNIIKEINWTNAFEVYKSVVDNDSGLSINSENFFDIAKSYPFGIGRDNNEYIVRDPISVNDKGELVCVGEVPENTAIDLLKGNPGTLINAAHDAINACKPVSFKVKNALIFDCISRYLFLGNSFEKELSSICDEVYELNENVDPIGVLTLGEISSHQGYLNFLNKTIVIGLLSD